MAKPSSFIIYSMVISYSHIHCSHYVIFDSRLDLPSLQRLSIRITNNGRILWDILDWIRTELADKDKEKEKDRLKYVVVDRHISNVHPQFHTFTNIFPEKEDELAKPIFFSYKVM